MQTAEADPDLGRWLVALHALEQQALLQLRLARRLVREPALAGQLSDHIAQTLEHRRTVRRLLADHGLRRSRIHDAGAAANRLGFVLYTAVGADAAGKLLTDSIAYEQLELAGYRMLAHAASRAGDEQLARVALRIAAEEQEMAARLETHLDWAVEDSARRSRAPTEEDLVRHLRYAHALSAQAEVLSAAGALVLPRWRMREYARSERVAARDQRRRLEMRLAGLDRRAAWWRSAVMAVAGAAWSVAWLIQPYTSATLVCFLYAERHLQIAAYELLTREAARAGDPTTEVMAAQMLSRVRGAANVLETLFEDAADAALSPDGRE